MIDTKVKIFSGCMMMTFALMFNFSVQAQDEISDDDLTKYALVMIQIDSMKDGMKDRTNELVKENELMDGGRAFNAIKSAKGDSLKLVEIGVSEEQVIAYEALNTEIESMKEDFKTKYTELITNDLGASTFNAVKRALDEASIKERYNKIYSDLEANNSSDLSEEG